MGLTRIAINRPLAMLMFILGLVIMGAVSFGLLKVDRMPAISMPFVNVNVSWAGAAPEDVESSIVKPLEQAVSGLPGVDTIDSTSSEGRGNVSITFVEGWDANQGAVDVERRLASMLGRLPSDASTPTVNKADPNSFPIMNVSLTGQLPLDELYNLAADMVQPRLQSIPGVADVSISGGLVREVRVRVDYTRLTAYGIAPSAIVSAISRENINTPGGSINQGRSLLNLRTRGQLQSADELADLIVASTPAGPIRLRDVATVTEGNKDPSSFQRLNGQESVGISITKSSEANSLSVADTLRASIASLQNSMPAGTQLVISNDSSRYTRSALDSIERDLVIAIVLCGAVLLLFLHAWRNTLIVLLAIPTSLVTTFLVMYATGMTLNTISMMALALTIGILVDDSIVVLENIHRHLRLGEQPRDAALKGRSEIGLAAMAITLTDVVVYLPVAFMSGTLGKMFREYGLTIASATLISLFISFTLTPMLASRWMKHNGDGRSSRWNPLGWFPGWWERQYGRLATGYGRLLGLALRARPLVLLVAVAAFVGALSLVPLHLLGIEYMPSEDDNQINVSISLPPGAGLDASNSATKQVEAMLIQQIPEIQNMFTTVRGGGGGGFGGGGGSIALQVVDKSQRQRTIFDIMNVIRRIGTGIPDATVRASASGGLGMGGGGGGGSLRIDVMGLDYPTLQKLIPQVGKVVRTVPGVADVREPDLVGQAEIRAVLDRQRMAELGVSGQQVASTLRTMISGTSAGQLQPEGTASEDITVVAADPDRLDLARLESMPIVTSTGSTVMLGQVARLVKAFSPLSITHTARQRVLTINATADGSRPLADVASDVRTALKDVPIPVGYSTVVGGSVRQMDAATGALTSALTLSIVLIYMLLVALFESWLYPLAIMLALPVSLIGAFGGLVLTGNTLNVFSMIGMIMLMGLVAKNAILLVDYTNTLRNRGMERTEALLEAGRTRLRPILMTTSTIVCSMIPLALKLEAGAESRSPMAVVVIGGVISSTLLTLLLVPAVYSYFDDLQQALGGPKTFRFLWKRRQTLRQSAGQHPAL